MLAPTVQPDVGESSARALAGQACGNACREHGRCRLAHRRSSARSPRELGDRLWTVDHDAADL